MPHERHCGGTQHPAQDHFALETPTRFAAQLRPGGHQVGVAHAGKDDQGETVIITTEECMPEVRWLVCHVQPLHLPGRVLQQQWKLTQYENGNPVGISFEWRTVPTVTEP